VQALTREKCELLARRWRLDAESSRALLQVVAKHYLKPEEAAALIALRTIPTQLSGDLGWAAVKTVVHGGRVLGARAELTKEQIDVLWAPLEPAIPLASVEEQVSKPVRGRVRAAVERAAAAITKPPASASAPGASQSAGTIRSQQRRGRNVHQRGRGAHSNPVASSPRSPAAGRHRDASNRR
jgi:hypothetical protein